MKNSMVVEQADGAVDASLSKCNGKRWVDDRRVFSEILLYNSVAGV